MSIQDTNIPTASQANPGRSAFAPVLLLAVALIALLLFQMTQLVRERTNLAQSKANQEQPVEESRALRAQLDGIAADTARLAEQGNANAQRVVEQLRQRGITINADSAAASAEE